MLIHQWLALGSIVVVFLLMGYVFRRFLPDRSIEGAAFVQEVLCAVLIMGIAGGMAVYLNDELRHAIERAVGWCLGRGVTGQAPLVWWRPNLSRLDTVLFWVLFGQAVVLVLGTVLHRRFSFGARFVTLGLGFVAAFAAYLGLANQLG